MKLSYLILSVMLLTGYNCYAQNAFPPTGPVGIGTNSPLYPFDVQHAGTGNSGAIVGIQGFVNAPGVGAYLRLIKSRGTTTGTFAPTLAGDGLGAVDFMGVRTDNAIGYAARIVGYQDGTAGATYIPGKLSFFTGSTANAMSERMTITSSGNVGIGTISPATQLHLASTVGPVLTLDKTNVEAWRLDVSEGSDFRLWNTSVGTAPLTMKASGNMGIGTITPTSKLQVYESSDSKPNGAVAATKSVLKLSRFGTPNYSYNESAEFRIGHGGPDVWGSRLDLYINGGNNTTDVPDQQAMTWLYNGNVGIGTINPIADFQVGNATASVSLGSAAAANLNYGSGYIGFNAARNAGSWTISGDNSHNGGGVIYSDLFGNIYMATIASNGGTNQTIADLDIKNRISFSITPTGLVRAKQIKVELNNWPDYVFKKDYQLKPLSEVKDYIDQNQHLPEIPTEEQIAKEGLNLGEMNKLLMKKVEELTLYLIQQQEANDQLKAHQEEQNKKQQEQIDQLVKQVNSLRENSDNK